MKTYSITEVAAALAGDSMKHPERWVIENIRRGRFTARRVGRQWRMTQDDIDNALDALANNKTATTTTSEVPVFKLSSASMRRRVSA